MEKVYVVGKANGEICAGFSHEQAVKDFITNELEKAEIPFIKGSIVLSRDGSISFNSRGEEKRGMFWYDRVPLVN